MQQITHPNNPRPTSPPHAVNPASRLIIQINFCRAQDADPDPDPFCSFYFKDGRRSSRWVGGWVHCRRPLARPRAQATKKTQARIWSWPKLFSSSRQAPRAQIFPTLGKDAAPHKFYPTRGKGAALHKFIHLRRAACPSTWERQFIPVFGRLLETSPGIRGGSYLGW